MPESTRPVSFRRIPVELWRQVKTVALEREQTCQAFVIEALRRHVDQHGYGTPTLPEEEPS